VIDSYFALFFRVLVSVFFHQRFDSVGVGMVERHEIVGFAYCEPSPPLVVHFLFWFVVFHVPRIPYEKIHLVRIGFFGFLPD
jgi:hypothetical protein